MTTRRNTFNSGESPEITMDSILEVVKAAHLQVVEKKDEHIDRLQAEICRLECENQELKQRFSEFRRSSSEEKGHYEEANQQKEQRLLVLQAKNKALEAELAKANASKQSEVARITMERDKANHIIRKLLNKSTNHSPSFHPPVNKIYESSADYACEHGGPLWYL